MRNNVRFLVAYVFFSLYCASAFAIPARRGFFTSRQSDGTVITFERVGDEFFHYTRTKDGYTIVQGKNGDYYFGKLASDGKIIESSVVVRPSDCMSPRERHYAEASRGLIPLNRGAMDSYVTFSGRRMTSALNSITASDIPDVDSFGGWGGEKKGNFRTLVILVNYQDVRFSISDPKNSFYNMLNESGYSENGGTGSAKDYFEDCSNGQFNPVFDVAGPYTLSRDMGYYGGDDDANAARMVLEACRLADDDVDFSQYADGNGVIRNVFIYYAGYNEAEGGPENSVWPHQWAIYPGYNVPADADVYFDGVQLCDYACSSELRGFSGTNMAGIGAICHEFGHVIGLPDLYDTDYNENGYDDGVGVFSVMDTGCYLNDGCTPPSYGMLERWMLGWAKPVLLNAAGSYSLEPIYDGKGYILMSPTDGEFFLFDNRSASANNKWDYYLLNCQGCSATGMLVYHIDESESSESLWSSNMINAYSSRPCVDILKAVSNSLISYWLFPGNGGKTKLFSASDPALRDWDGNGTSLFLVNIALAGKNVVFDLANDEEKVETLNIFPDSLRVGMNCCDTVAFVQSPSTSVLTDLSWKSGNSCVAKVNDGIVYGVDSGTTVIRACNLYNTDACDSVWVRVMPAAYDICGDMGQYDATVSWTSDGGYGSWKAVCRERSGGHVVTYALADGVTDVNLRGLQPGTSYLFEVSAMVDGKAVAGPYDFPAVTEYGNKDGKPSYDGLPDTCTSSDLVKLRIKNVGNEVKNISWTVDGESVSSVRLKLSEGTHKIVAKILDSNGNTEYLVKYITVTG
ncbi:MAG: M6 family metalloprotease domain-containing protein [Bacteroidales bacterium]|jgi:M6 family metalloprotease-like protein|nr:M6 family metalloprotease domain-containing protein [Bacteroidales bacterium]MCI2121379.1 M6 family metalloprotease domain-containing protein [Bacteroidales bacterium]MCI2145502.1 M6 family metalloprotease domain-containing protein [Bacteroidales bacterium]